MKKKILSSLIIVFSLMIGGCNSVSKTKEKPYVTSGNVIDVEAAKEAGFEEYKPLTPEEIVFEEEYDDERLKYAKENWKQIKEVSENYIKSIAKRDDVEVFNFYKSPVPGNIIAVKYRTINFPEIIGSADIVWDEEGNFGVREMYEKEVELLEVTRLLNFAFSDELNELKTKFSKEFPEYITMPKGSMEALNYGMIEEYFMIYSSGLLNGDKPEKILQAYYENPEITKEQLKKILIEQNNGVQLHVSIDINLIAKSIYKKPNKKDVARIDIFFKNNSVKDLEFVDVYQTLIANLHKQNTGKALYRVFSGYTSPSKYKEEWS